MKWLFIILSLLSCTVPKPVQPVTVDVKPLSQVLIKTNDTAIINEQYPEFYGAYNDGTHSKETTLAFKIMSETGIPIKLQVGTYLVDSITSTRQQPLIIQGVQREKSVIKLTGKATIGISIGWDAHNEQSELKDFSLIGNEKNIGGICLGKDYTFYTAWTSIHNVKIYGFSNGYGISLNSVQELDIENCDLKYNYNNIYRPNQGYLTSTLIHGKNSHIGYAVNRGIFIEGPIVDLTLRDVIIELNSKEGFYYDYPSTGNILIDNCYIEANCVVGGDCGIFIKGGEDKDKRISATIRDCQFNGSWRDNVKIMVKLDGVSGGIFSQNRGLGGGRISTTETVQCHFEFNAQSQYYFVDWKTHYKNMKGKISAIDVDLNGDIFYYNINLNK